MIIRLLVFLMVCIHVVATERSTIDTYLYGPYFDDPSIETVNFTEPTAYFKSKKCDKSAVTKLNNDFLEPGLFNINSSIENVGNIITCAWKQYEPSYILLEKVVYADQLAQVTTDQNMLIRQLIYHPTYILNIAKLYPSLFSAVPDSHPNYLEIATELVTHDPANFDYLTLRFKRNPKITKLLFSAKTTYDDIYKHYAIQYSLNDRDRKEYIKHNGLLYLELPVEVRDNPYLAYYAFVQNDIVYPYIPNRIKKLFKDQGPIKVPRYMTKLVLIKQKIMAQLALIIKPLSEALFGGDGDVDIAVEIDEKDPLNPENVNIEEEIVIDELDFRNERTVVTDIRIINKIENFKDRRLMHLWRIARYGKDGQVYVAMFRPDGKDYLGAVVVKHGARLMFSDYSAVFSMDGENIWRIDDKGKFNARSFVLNRVVKENNEQLKFSFSWKGEYTTNDFDLIDSNGILLKEFVNYYFE